MNRGNILKKNISVGLVTKILGMGLSYVSLPIILNYLGERNYGVWITIFSILSWIYNFDVGIGNGLRTKLSEALAKKDMKSAKEYISTSYIIILIITIILLLIGSIGISLSDFTESLSIDFLDESYIKMVIFISFIFTLGNFVIGLYKQLFYAIHKSALVGMTNVLYQILVIFLLLLFKRYYDSSLLMLAFIYGISNILVGIVFTVIFFKKRMEFLPKFKFFSKEKVKDIAGLGIKFFVIQICTIIIFTTDNLIITKFLGPQEVTSYSVVSKLFQSIIMLWYIISAPLWSLYTDAYVKKDKKWILKTFKRLNILFVFILCGVIVLVLLSNVILNFWLQKKLDYPQYIFLFFGLFVLIRIYGDIYMSFLNGIGKVKIQLILSIGGALINVPLSVYFIKYLNLGSAGVILATNISLISLALVMPLQAFYEIKKMKTLEDK